MLQKNIKKKKKKKKKGGETVFYDNPGDRDPTVKVIPQAGSALVFKQDVVHAGLLVTKVSYRV